VCEEEKEMLKLVLRPRVDFAGIQKGRTSRHFLFVVRIEKSGESAT
jgi:hypothetical protein